MALIRFERTGNLTAKSPGQMVSTLFTISDSFKNRIR